MFIFVSIKCFFKFRFGCAHAWASHTGVVHTAKNSMIWYHLAPEYSFLTATKELRVLNVVK